MKRKIRIKLMQEKTRCINLTNVLNDCDTNESYRLREEKNKLNDKIIFYERLCKTMEVKNDKI